MGFEYRFIINQLDLENLSRWPDGINNLDKLLQSAPGFLKIDSPNVYTYTEKNNPSEKWKTTIHIETTGFIICMYSRKEDSNDLKLFNFLIHTILTRCGRICIEDA